MLKYITKTILISVLFLMNCISVQAAETNPVVEVYSCDYLSGKDQGDLDKAVGFWQQGLKKINSNALNSYFGVVLSPIHSSFDSDFYWLGSNTNLNTWAKGNADYFASKEGQAADAKFAKMSKCKSNLYFSTPLYQALTPTEEGAGAVIMTAACTLKEGKTMQNVMAVEAPRLKQLNANKAQSSVFRLVPYIARTSYDVVYLIVHSNLESFGSAGTKQITSANWMATSQAFNETMQCEAGLFNSKIVHLPIAAM